MNKIFILMFGLFLIGFISAVTIYPGETNIFNNTMGIENLVYIINGNSTAIELDIQVNSTNIVITLPQDMIPDSFDIIFLEEQTNIVVQEVSVGGGGGSRTIYKDKNVTEYIEVPDYIDREVEVPGEEIIVKIKQSWGYWVLGVLILVLLWILYQVYTNRDTMEEKEYE